MNLFSELIAAVQSDMTIGSESTLFPLATVKLALNRAYSKAGGLYKWPDLEDAKTTDTQSNIEYYDYPQTWRPNSIWKLVVDGEDYGDPITFKDYLYEQENDYPSGENKLWANQWRRYFIYPTPTTPGTNNITVWGIENVEELVEDADVTIFSYSTPEGNEAVVLEAVAILKNKGEIQRDGLMLSAEAKAILAGIWKRTKQEKSKYEKTQPFLNVPDFFSGNGNQEVKDTIGNF